MHALIYAWCMCDSTFPILYSHVQTNVQQSIRSRYPKTTAATMERNHHMYSSYEDITIFGRSAYQLTSSLSLASYNSLINTDSYNSKTSVNLLIMKMAMLVYCVHEPSNCVSSSTNSFELSLVSLSWTKRSIRWSFAILRMCDSIPYWTDIPSTHFLAHFRICVIKHDVTYSRSLYFQYAPRPHVTIRIMHLCL